MIISIMDTDFKYIFKIPIFSKFMPFFITFYGLNKGINTSYVMFLAKSVHGVE